MEEIKIVKTSYVKKEIETIKDTRKPRGKEVFGGNKFYLITKK